MGGTASDRRPLDPINKIRDAFIHRPTGASSEQNFLTLFLLPKFPGLLYTFLPGGIATTADELFTPFKQDVGDGGGGQFLLKGQIENVPGFENQEVKLRIRCRCRGKESPTNAGDARDTGSVPESGTSRGGGNGDPLQDSYNSMDGGAQGATVHGVQRAGHS